MKKMVKPMTKTKNPMVRKDTMRKGAKLVDPLLEILNFRRKGIDLSFKIKGNRSAGGSFSASFPF